MGSLSVFQLEPLIERYRITTFIETGTNLGAGVRCAQAVPFEQIYSIEITPELVDKLRPEFAPDPRVQLLVGDSAQVLKDLLPRVKTNALFWLDAHLPGKGYGPDAYEKNEQIRLPLERELRVIQELRQGFGDVILCDDLWMYEEDRFEHGNMKDYNVQYLGKFDSRFIYTVLQGSHECHRYLRDEGYIVYLPRGAGDAASPAP